MSHSIVNSKLQMNQRSKCSRKVYLKIIQLRNYPQVYRKDSKSYKEI